jgi:hypothetical protein
LAIEHHRSDTESAGDIRTPETVLGAVFTVVGLDVPVCDQVVEEVSEKLSDDAANDGCKVEEGGVLIIKEVRWRADELCNCCDDTNSPGKEDKDEEA